ncbi:MAG: electron transfer flavoprotein subunit alpha/FixB family protein [Deltaproteobacteria bacterium]|nr:electron transfer flavoprotein subunit alpha/FixB family protein [Deltaproteobacteria bacterium]
MVKEKKEIWVFGDYRNYFQDRVTLQLLARATELADDIDGIVCAVLFGHDLDEYVGEYIAHGARKVYVMDHPRLKNYQVEVYAGLLGQLSRRYKPAILLAGATSFGREFIPRVAKQLKTGLTADCVGLDINEDGHLVQTAPFFGGNLMAKIITPKHRPQMATVRPGIFQEIPHDDTRSGDIIRLSLPERLPRQRVRLISSKRHTKRAKRIEEAKVVVCGGRGMGSKTKFKKLFDLAATLGGELGATRPVVYSKWADSDALVGQAGKNISPKLLFSFGISGAIQHTAAITGSDLIVAVNKNPDATMMRMADVAIVADANQVCATLLKELKKRIRDKTSL